MIAGRASATALLVALSVLRLGRAHGLPELSVQMAKQALKRSNFGWRCLARLANWHGGRACLNLIEWLCCAGLGRHHCSRKAWLQQRLQDAPQPRRWLWLGTGFDAAGLAARVRQPKVSLLELDHPGSLALRQQLPAWRLHASSVQSLPLYLPQQSSLLLAVCAPAPALLIAEGVLMYLPARSLLRLLVELSRLREPPRLLFSALTAVSGTDLGFHCHSHWQASWLARRGESFQWRLSAPSVARLLQRCGYQVVAQWAASGFGEYLLDAVYTGRPKSDRLLGPKVR